MTQDDRIYRDMRELIRAEVRALGIDFAGLYSYTIVGVTGDPPSCLVDAVPVDPSRGLPGIIRLRLSPDVGGISSRPDVGLGCRVAFLDRDPSRPVVVGVDPMGDSPIARLGDTVNAGYIVTDATGAIKQVFPGTLAGLAAATAYVGANPGYVNWPLNDGRVTSGSAKVVVG